MVMGRELVAGSVDQKALVERRRLGGLASEAREGAG